MALRLPCKDVFSVILKDFKIARNITVFGLLYKSSVVVLFILNICFIRSPVVMLTTIHPSDGAFCDFWVVVWSCLTLDDRGWVKLKSVSRRTIKNEYFVLSPRAPFLLHRVLQSITNCDWSGSLKSIHLSANQGAAFLNFQIKHKRRKSPPQLREAPISQFKLFHFFHSKEKLLRKIEPLQKYKLI